MQLISLNIWGGHIHLPLMDFFKQYQDVDVFLLQEVYHGASASVSTDNRTYTLNILHEIKTLLPNHEVIFHPLVDGVFGLAMLVKKSILIQDHGFINIYDNPDYPGRGPTHKRDMQWLQAALDGQAFHVFNIHGLWNGQGKTDSDTRIEQSKAIRSFVDELGVQTPIFLCGDFNLRPETKSLAILEKGFVNLIKSHGITSTRTRYYDKEEKYADYVLVTKDIHVRQFKVCEEEISDHCALWLDVQWPSIT